MIYGQKRGRELGCLSPDVLTWDVILYPFGGVRSLALLSKEKGMIGGRRQGYKEKVGRGHKAPDPGEKGMMSLNLYSYYTS